MYRFLLTFQSLLAGLLRQDERGATAVEYGLILAAVAAVIFVVARTLGTHVAQAFTSISGMF